LPYGLGPARRCGALESILDSEARMAVTEEARNHLFNTFRAVLGQEAAVTAMELLPPVGWGDVARQSDIARLESRFGDRFADIDRRFDELPQRLATKDDLQRLTTRFVAWMVASNTTLIAAATLLRLFD
jgi:hypothetical protein